MRRKLVARGFEIPSLTASPTPVAIRAYFPSRQSFPDISGKPGSRPAFRRWPLILHIGLLYCLGGKARGRDLLFTCPSRRYRGGRRPAYAASPHGIRDHNTEVTQNWPDGAGWSFQDCPTVHRGSARRSDLVRVERTHDPRPDLMARPGHGRAAERGGAAPVIALTVFRCERYPVRRAHGKREPAAPHSKAAGAFERAGHLIAGNAVPAGGRRRPV